MIKRDEQRALGAPTPSMITRPLSRYAESPAIVTGDDAVERRAGRLLANVADPPSLDRAAIARVEERLFGSSATARDRPRFGLRRLALGSMFGGVALLASGAVVAGIGIFWKASPAETRPPVHEAVVPEAARARAAKPPRALARAEVAPELAPPAATGEKTATAPESTPPARPDSWRSSPARAVPPLPRGRTSSSTPFESLPLAAPAATAEPTLGALARETHLLGQALKQLRQRRDGAAALALLDDYAGRFPGGTLAAEARRARIDALLLLDRRDEALRSLEAANLEPVGRGQELLIIRGELRGRADCSAAIADFDLALSRSAPPGLGERALYGRAICAARLGRGEAARADARAYVARYPAGRFAAAARRMTGGEGAPPSKD